MSLASRLLLTIPTGISELFSRPLLSKDRNNIVYWLVAVAYAGFVAVGSEGFWWFLSLVLTAFAARQAFPVLVQMIGWVRDSNAVAKLSTDEDSKKLVIVSALAVALFTIAVPLQSPWASFAGALVVWFGSQRLVAPPVNNEDVDDETGTF